MEDRCRILLAEDNPLIMTILEALVTRLGYAIVAQVTCGQHAVALTEKLRPDVVLMDIEMPDLDGIEATRLIQEFCPTPVVIMTAYDDPELVQRASAAGVGAYLVKPPDAGQMERALIIARARFNDIMELRRLNAQLQTEILERRRAENALVEANQALEQRLREIKTLRGFLPICARCKKIRDDRGYWHAVESYIATHTEAEFSHGYCPECASKIKAEIDSL